jgi:4-methyl-5(b-hydroxyethyl)-thiazole monophosphate biosynthesis
VNPIHPSFPAPGPFNIAPRFTNIVLLPVLTVTIRGKVNQTWCTNLDTTFKGDQTMSKKVLVPIANGSEEIEAVCIIDILRRAGAEVTVASVHDLQITASRGVRIVADKLLEDCRTETYDLIALPGGIPGAEHLGDHPFLIEMLKRQRDQGRFYAAICASPAVVFQPHGLLENHKATSHPAFIDRLENIQAAESRTVVDGNCITSRGPGTAIEFALKLVEVLYGVDKMMEVGAPMVLPQ